MSDIVAIKAAIDTAITNKVADDSITPAVLGGSMKATADELRPYKVYTFNIKTIVSPFVGTEDPEVTVLENTIGAIVWSRFDVGKYEGVLTGAFPEGKTWCMANVEYSTTMQFFRLNDDEVYLYTYNSVDNNLNDAMIELMAMEIRVYP